MWWRKKEMVCQQAVDLVTDYLEDALSSKDRARLEAHLGACPHCTEYFAQIRHTVAATGSVKADSLGEDALNDLVALYRSWTAG